MKRKIIIYGASTSAQNIKNLLDFFGVKIFCFAVTRLEGNPAEIDGIPVYEAAKILPEHKDALVLIALLKAHYDTVKSYLDEIGVQEYMEAGLESEVDIRLRRAYFKKKAEGNSTKFFLADKNSVAGEGKRLSMEKLCEDFTIFMVRNHKDKVIAKVPVEEWVVPIQAGAANTTERLAEIRDDSGADSISERNYNYCELTAAYWMWKNVDAKYIGLCHYRRKFPLTAEQVQEFMENDMDVCAPLPGLLSPNMRVAYIHMQPANARYEEDLNRMLRAIEFCEPEYLKSAKEVLEGRTFIHYNMLVAKKAIFGAWCDFWYSVLSWVEKSYEAEEIYRKDRYLGFLGELLTTIFLYHHKEYRILYAELLFLE